MPRLRRSAEGERRLGGFTSPEARRRYLAAYDAAMALMPIPDEIRDLPTAYGTVRVYYYAPTTREARAHAPLVLLPGTRSGAPVFADNLAGLRECAPVYVLDLLGEPGRSVQTAPIASAADQSAWLHEVLRTLPERRFHLCGLSIGGWTAVNCALASEESIASLVLVEPVNVFAGLSWQVYLRSIPASVRWFPKAWREAFSSWSAGGVPVEDEPVGRMIEAGMQAYDVRQPAIARIPARRLGGITVPVLVLVAGDSPIHRAEAVARTARAELQHGTVRVYPGASHAINGEFPERIAEDVRAFLPE